jgi:hypothetical protein
VLQYVKEFNKSGAVVKVESFSSYNTGDIYLKETEYFDENGLLVRIVKQGYPFDDTNIESDITNEYDENGNLIKKLQIVYRGGAISQTILREFDENGRDIHLLHEMASGETSESFHKYGQNNEVIDYKSYKNGVLTENSFKKYDENGNLTRESRHTTHWKTDEFYTYNSNNLRVEYKKYTDDALEKRTVYEYHQNGQRSSVITYDAEGNIISETYYNENGIYIPKN